MGNALGSASPTLKAPAQSSVSQNTSVGGGSRPGGSAGPKTPSSAPMDPRTLGRAPSGWLK